MNIYSYIHDMASTNKMQADSGVALPKNQPSMHALNKNLHHFFEKARFDSKQTAVLVLVLTEKRTLKGVCSA